MGVLSLPLYPSSTCAAAVSLLKSLGPWTPAEIREEVGAGRYAAVVRDEARAANILAAGLGDEIRAEFEARVERFVQPLIEEFWELELRRQTPVEVVRYQEGGHYRSHSDAALDVADRYFSVVCYLNDGFAGGRTVFPALRYASAPEPGKAIVFPSTYVHYAEPVIGGEKFILASWVLGPPPRRWLKRPPG